MCILRNAVKKYLVLIKYCFYYESLLVFLDCCDKNLRKKKMSGFTSVN